MDVTTSTARRLLVLNRIIGATHIKVSGVSADSLPDACITNNRIHIDPPPSGLIKEFNTIFTPEAVDFLTELVLTFDSRVQEVYDSRLTRKYNLQGGNALPDFATSPQRSDKTWRVRSLPKHLQDRRLDLGDVSPTNIQHFTNALKADVNGIQVDFDDAHCPNWHNQILGHYNIYCAAHGLLPGIKPIKNLPILMLRPRAWNMIDHNIMINGKEVPGPLVDYALLMYHNAKILYENNAGPCFYLSKIEGANEVKLWNDIFVWTQHRLKIPYGTIKACVLIENILASFQLEEILYEIKDHSLGLNCGIWDYSASIISKFGGRPQFVLPDRNKYVNMERHFLKTYMQLVVQVCHERGAHATGGMAALLTHGSKNAVEKIVKSKATEISMGVDGFMVYDVAVVSSINQLWFNMCGSQPNQLDKIYSVTVTPIDLLTMPSGGVTSQGLAHNVEVAILFIFYWLNGIGHFYYKNSVEDSATAEISRSQIWQWIRHKATIEDNNQTVTKALVKSIADAFAAGKACAVFDGRRLAAAVGIFMEIVTAYEFPEFITTFLNDSHVFRSVSEC